MRGSSIPQASSGCTSGRAGRVGSGSMRQPLAPFELLATVRCEKPRRSSTSRRKMVSLSTIVAAGLNTAFAEYGRSRAVKIGLSAWRWNSSGGDALPKSSDPLGPPELARCLERVHLKQRVEPGEGRLGALVVVHP